MAEGRESVAYALPFCAGTVTGIFICGYRVLHRTESYLAASISSAACLILLAAWFFGREKTRGLCGIAPVAAAMFFCGIFCWSSHALGELSVPGDRKTLAEELASPAAAWLKSSIDSLPLRDYGSNALIKALVTGDRSDVPESTEAAFRDSGASHILALSGMHLAVIYMILSKILSVFGQSRPADKVRFAIILGSTFFYSVMTGSSPSIIRAFLFITLRETALLTGRKARPANILCSSLTIQCALSPPVITSASFQLSYLAMCGIYFLYQALRDLYPAGVPVIKKIWDSAAMSIACQAFTGPLAWLLFGSAPAYFIITNLIAVPLSSALMPAALAAAFLYRAGLCPDFIIRGIDMATVFLVDCLKVICQLP